MRRRQNVFFRRAYHTYVYIHTYIKKERERERERESEKEREKERERESRLRQANTTHHNTSLLVWTGVGLMNGQVFGRLADATVLHEGPQAKIHASFWHRRAQGTSDCTRG